MEILLQYTQSHILSTSGGPYVLEVAEQTRNSDKDLAWTLPPPHKSFA